MRLFHSTFFTRRAFARIGAIPVLATGALALGAARAHAQDAVPAELQGTWVPSKGTCEAPARVVVAADRLTLINGKDQQALGGVQMAGPSYWGPDYNGIMAVLITEFDDQQPATMSFNVGEKKGVAQVEFSPVQPGQSNAQLAKYNARISQLNLAKRFPLNKVLLKKCSGGSGDSAPADKPGKPAAAGPSLCAGVAHCTEVKPFAATVTDFRTSTAGQTRVVTINMRFQNRTAGPLILGYVQGSGIVTDDRGNRYVVAGQGAVRGIGEISNNRFDPKFTLQPGEASDARVEFLWTPQRGQIFGTTYGVELAVREIEALPSDQYQLGKEYALKLDGFTAGAPTPAAQATATPTGTVEAATAASVATAAADAPDACAGKSRCYSAGPFAAEVTQVTTSKVSYYVYMHINVKVRNVTTQPMILGYQNGSGTAIDDAGNRYAAKTVKGIGIVTASAADPQFVLNPGQSRDFSIDYVNRPGRAVVGTSWTADLVLEQLEVLPSRQVRSVRDFAVSYQDLTPGKAMGSTASPSSGTDGNSATTADVTAGAVKAVGKLFKSK